MNLKQRRRRRRNTLFSARTAAAAILVTAATLVAASVASGDVATGRAAKSENVKLTFMSNAQSTGIETAWKELIEAYEKANPNVTITRTPVAFSAYDTTAKLRASSSSPPDLIEGGSNPGGTLATLAKANLLLPVDKYAAQVSVEEEVRPAPAISSACQRTGRRSAPETSSESPTSQRSSASSTTSSCSPSCI